MVFVVAPGRHDANPWCWASCCRTDPHACRDRTAAISAGRDASNLTYVNAQSISTIRPLVRAVTYRLLCALAALPQHLGGVGGLTQRGVDFLVNSGYGKCIYIYWHSFGYRKGQLQIVCSPIATALSSDVLQTL
ncbi:hypothetical protein BCAR13_440115 [Paraburkholderia caribensis]|nr:hypothetical protein BCAR13_440115 [Paraburkholderia caribensis]